MVTIQENLQPPGPLEGKTSPLVMHSGRDKDNSFIPRGDAPGDIMPRVDDNVANTIRRVIGIPSRVPAVFSCQVESLPVGLIPQGDILLAIRVAMKPPSGAQSGDKHDSVSNTGVSSFPRISDENFLIMISSRSCLEGLAL